ncbi:hypothetical protein SD67_00025 [Acinetobacter pittii]|uniref:hypothetical protein n=2 Tax=Acinetobacter pittii TaxID=48296 RepID=UPI000585B75D|nr:hypothetical protein [Acinetobacter pittii]KIE86988.1 hypothetical protein SD67_00025 [Acinetobacter pittii]
MSININDTVHIPAISVGLDSQYPFAMVSGKVLSKTNSKVNVQIDLNGGFCKDISLSLARKKLGILIIQIGDMETEETLLNPLRKSILQFTRLLLSDDYIRCISIRTLEEFKFFWEKEQALMSHIVLIGHGSANSIRFGGNDIKVKEIKKIMSGTTVGEAKQIISLCCKTGGAWFGKVISGQVFSEIFIGPSGSVHAANASQFYQSYMTYNLLSGYNTEVAYDYARVSNPGVSEFNLWRKTKLHKKRSKQKIFGSR